MQIETLRFNPFVDSMRPSATLAMSARAKQLRREGRPVISLSAGEPDFGTPEPIAAAAKKAIDDGFTHYTENSGMLELREEICRKLERDNGLAYGPESVLCSNGAKQSVAQTVLALCAPGDEVLIPAPYWVSYPEMVRLTGATPIAIETTAQDGYLVDPERLQAAITPRTRLLILCSPSNPTGAVYSQQHLELLARVLRAHPDIFVLSDEIYERIVYDVPFASFASLDGMKERTITVNGFSKCYAMTGWRLGYLAARPDITKVAAKVQSQFSSAPSSISQKAGLAALRMDDKPIREMVAEFRRRRDALLQSLAAIPGLQCPLPDGAFYAFPDVGAYLERTAGDRLIRTSTDLCMYILEEHNVALVAGDAFGAPSGLRISYAASLDDIRQAAAQLAEGLRRIV